MSGGPSVTLNAVSKWYGDVLAVNEVSGEFGPGVTGLLGPNGAGKSTLLKVITGMLEPSLGRVELLGEAPFDNARVMRRVGLVPEQDAIYPGATARQMVTYLTRLQGYSAGDARSRAESALVRVGLEQAMDRPVQGYSKGMRQRMKLAQALTGEPEVLILDEPMNGLDPLARRDMASLIREIGERGAAVVVSSHVLHEVEAMTRRILLLDHGRVIADGTIEEIRADLADRPLSVHVECADVRAVARRVVDLEGVRRVDLAARELDVLTVRPEALFRELARLATEDAAAIRRYGPTDETLEAVFRYLTT